MKGYKVFKPDWTTMNDFQWEVGKTYEHTGDLEMCASGFHFCKNLLDCFHYYDFAPKNKVAEIEALGNIKEGVHKCLTDKIKIVREIPWEEVLAIVNIGHGNTGYKNIGVNNNGSSNAGDFNSGNYNTGSCNSGDYNTGCCNSGDYNTCYYNTGSYNTGSHNIGNHNTGSYNIGNHNSGAGNSGNYNTGSCNRGDHNSGSFNACCHSTGFFNTDPSTIYMFNKPCDLTWEEINELPGIMILRCFRMSEWVDMTDMSNKEKAVHPNYTVTEGYLKDNHFEEAFKKFWQGLHENEHQAIKDLPNFDPVIFKSITGINISDF